MEEDYGISIDDAMRLALETSTAIVLETLNQKNIIIRVLATMLLDSGKYEISVDLNDIKALDDYGITYNMDGDMLTIKIIFPKESEDVPPRELY